MSPFTRRNKAAASNRKPRRRTATAAVPAEVLETRTLLTTVLGLSGIQSIDPGGTTNVNGPGGTFDQDEPTFDINPTNPLQLVGINTPGGGRLEIHTSLDGGATWTSIISANPDGLGNDPANIARFDPSIAFDDNGDLYFAYILGTNPAGTPQLDPNTSHMIVGRSDGGTSFGDFTFSVVDTFPDPNGTTGGPPGIDKPHLAIGPDGLGGQAVYVTYTGVVHAGDGSHDDAQIRVAASNDGGSTWTSPVIINDGSIGGDDRNNIHADPAVGPNGEIYIAWINTDDGVIYLDRDLDGLFSGGQTWGLDRVVTAPDGGVFFKNTGSAADPISAQPDRGIHTGPVLDVDRSGGFFDGRLYLTYVEWADQTQEDTEVFVARSANQGNTWIEFSVDPSTGTEFLPWVDVDQTSGSVNVMYLTTDGDQATGNDDVRPRISSSFDGGTSWVTTANLSPLQSNETGGSGGDYLEYNGFAVHDGTIHGFWASRYPGGGVDLDVLTANAAFQSVSSNNTLFITGPGTGTADLITVQRSPANEDYLEVFVDFQREFTGLARTIDRIVINGAATPDIINIYGLPENVELIVNGGGGADTINIGDGNLDRLFENDVSFDNDISVNGGGGGGDILNVNDSMSLDETDYFITGGSVIRHPSEIIEYNGIESLNFDGANAASSYLIGSTSAVTTVTGGNQADEFGVGAFINTLIGIDASLTIVGGGNIGGDDVVGIVDSNGTNLVYGIDDNRVFGFGFADIELDGVERAALHASSLDNQIFVENAPTVTRYIVNGYDGNDTITLAAVSQNLSGFNRPLVVDGGTGENHLILRDDSTLNNLAFVVTDNSIDRLLFGEFSPFPPHEVGVTFSNMADVELFLNDDGNTVNVNSTHPDTKYIFHGNDGADTLNLNRHTDESVDPFVDIDGVDITSSAMDIEHHHFEQLNLNLGDELSTVRVHDLNSPAALNLGLGDDRVFVTPDSGLLGAIDQPIVVNGQGGVDRVHLHDNNHSSNAHYGVTKNSVNRLFFGPLLGSEPGLTYFDVDFLRLFMGAGESIVNINSTAPGTEYFFDGGFGDDTFNVNLLPTSRLTLFGSVGEDHAVITGTDLDDEVSISAGFGTADINMPNTETASFNGNGGTDVLVAEGVAGMTEQMEIESSATANAGDLRITTLTPRGNMLLDVVFEDTEILDLIANPGDGDTATFIGTDEDDRFEINLGAAGTNADPVLQFFQPGGETPLLTLRDYQGFDTLGILGGDGGDEFNVYVAPTGPGNGRNLNIDGGSPSGPGNPNDMDRLTVFREFQQPPPPPGGNQPSKPDGTIDIMYELYQFLIGYSNMEQVQIQPANSGNGGGNGTGNGNGNGSN